MREPSSVLLNRLMDRVVVDKVGNVPADVDEEESAYHKAIESAFGPKRRNRKSEVCMMG
jgi:hypothetical protein